MLVLVVTTILMFIYIGFWVSIIIFISLVGIFFMIRLIFKMLVGMVHGTETNGERFENQQ